ncbi:hypothetical protein ADIARSV_2807 [Arcticibacter svalbardensis MN12-7]|uniref:Nucleotide-diphospho-sugar transferase domain-containing protein n=1 Tax=Arcticibacter svalbardensis MN12-7 TaxID=1150600 RepID=R9GQH5_9SPHI|nr:hypothetical protein [Arcticibacter svalbardensis]EOR93973.1 hypothetical protein ADIARSV_2807 [Arcticibacter svalbardensis MN12-7]
MKDIPLIFVHKGNSSYLKPVLAHNYAFNKVADIYLLGDEQNGKIPFVKHEMMEQYSATADKFAKIYEHMSSNPYQFELGCFQRWFIINEFVKQKGIEHFLYLDSDVMLFCNVKEVFNHFLPYDFTISQAHSPHITLFNSASLDRFCNYITELYSKPEYIARFKLSYQEFKDANRLGGICDMFAFSLYQQDVSDHVKEISEPSGAYYFDSNINESDGFEMKAGLKKVYWKNNLPYAKTTGGESYVQLYALHFQGAAKSQVSRYALNQRLERPGIISFIKQIIFQ